MSTTTITGTAAIDHAARTGAQLYKHADPVDGARAVTLDEAREIAREDVGLVWCRRPMTAAEQGEHDAEQRAHEALSVDGDGAEWQSEADAVAGWGEYAATAASHLDVPHAERAAWCDAYETAARETARRMYREATEWTVSDDCGGRWPTTITAADAESALDGAEAQVQRARAAYEGAATVRVTVASDAGSWSREVSL